jgi:hypothetical protein
MIEKSKVKNEMKLIISAKPLVMANGHTIWEGSFRAKAGCLTYSTGIELFWFGLKKWRKNVRWLRSQYVWAGFFHEKKNHNLSWKISK